MKWVNNFEVRFCEELRLHTGILLDNLTINRLEYFEKNAQRSKQVFSIEQWNMSQRKHAEID